MKNTTKYPEIEKALKVQEQSQKLGFFLEWLKSRFTLCQHTDTINTVFLDALDDYEAKDNSIEERMKAAISNDIYEKGDYLPAMIGIEEILALYFEIDNRKLQEERTAAFNELRAKQVTL